MQYRLADLHYLMSRLRDPEEGCPWDLEQSWSSIVPSTIEEAYEVADAIEREDFDAVREELGDLLFQVVFYARLAEEQGRFNLEQVVHDLTAKLLRRHPHVFPGGSLSSRADDAAHARASVRENWERIKEAEREAKGQGDLFDDVPLNLPAMTRAQKLQKRAARVGFDWPEVALVFDKIAEELDELKAEIEVGDRCRMESELGDLLFAVVNLCRHLQVDGESALRRCNARFVERLAHMQEWFEARGGTLDGASPEMLESAWERAKAELKQERS